MFITQQMIRERMEGNQGIVIPDDVMTLGAVRLLKNYHVTRSNGWLFISKEAEVLPTGKQCKVLGDFFTKLQARLQTLQTNP